MYGWAIIDTMFVFGETNEKVINCMVALPKKFHWKNINLVGKWVNRNTLYLSDNSGSLNFTAGSAGISFVVERIGDDKILIPSKYENSTVFIKGCITTIELVFINECK